MLDAGWFKTASTSNACRSPFVSIKPSVSLLDCPCLSKLLTCPSAPERNGEPSGSSSEPSYSEPTPKRQGSGGVGNPTTGDDGDKGLSDKEVPDRHLPGP